MLAGVLDSVFQDAFMDEIRNAVIVGAPIGMLLLAIFTAWSTARYFLGVARDEDTFDRAYEKMELGEDLTDEEAEMLFEMSEEVADTGFTVTDNICPHCGEYFDTSDEDTWNFHAAEFCVEFDPAVYH